MNFNPAIPEITTDQLVLRAFTMGDAASLYHIMSEEGVLRYFPTSDPPSLERVEQLIAGQLRHWEKHGYGWWAVVLQGEGELIGWSGLQYLPDTDEVEVAYLLAKAYWGQGLAPEAARAGLQFGFERLGLERIVAIVHVDNGASQRVAEKLGMTFEKEAEYFGMACYRYAMHVVSWRRAARGA
jgi:ribosomal-protein-alanine N-acetyltransferase